MISIIFILFLLSAIEARNSAEIDKVSQEILYTIEGRVFPLSDYHTSQQNWQANSRIHINGGEYIGFVRRDGSFVVHNIPSGSYIVEVLNPEYTFEPVRVEISSKGKYRARRVNHILTAQIDQVPYPLKVKALGKTRYFQMREQWRITDLLFNPMVMMMVMPLLLIMVLPKLMNDPETKKEMEQIQNLGNLKLPEVSEMMTNLLAGGNNPAQLGSGGKETKKGQKNKKRLQNVN